MGRQRLAVGPGDGGAGPEGGGKREAAGWGVGVVEALGVDEFLNEAGDGGDELDALAFGATPGKGDEVVGQGAGDFEREIFALAPEMREAVTEV